MTSSHQRKVDLEDFIDDAYRRGSVPDADGAQIDLAPHSVMREQVEALRELPKRRRTRWHHVGRSVITNAHLS